jgi:anhydro-N-acetylmuramic acid kinase
MRVIGMISGTSFDGIDVATADIHLDGTTVVLRPVSARTHPYSPELRSAIAAALPPNQTSAGDICALDTQIGQEFAAAATEAIAAIGSDPADLIVTHGQTIFHWVDGRDALGTLQLGQPAWIAAATGLPVVSDLRSRDIAHGGHGAPLVSLMDVLLLGDDDPRTRAALNLGGIANLTIAGGGIAPVAFDTGPANALLDAAVQVMTDGMQSYDGDGVRAARGTVDHALLERLLSEPYYALEPPKSTGKEVFHLDYLRTHLGDRPIDEDVLATLVALTADTVAHWCRHYQVTELIVAGGGVANPTLMGALRDRIPGAEVTTIEALGLPADAKEAYLFALLGFFTVHGLAGTVASCTGAREASILGSVTPGRHGLPTAFGIVDPPPRRLLIEAGA